ncbi:MAG: hypothetical protein RMJ33_13925 [Saprospiraceae bacterium]|nr:hypothetical protein [Saprospiraceae bacterium]MDW8230927.1 hypothetical protein [Saprospiraceae bacterium]
MKSHKQPWTPQERWLVFLFALFALLSIIVFTWGRKVFPLLDSFY